MGNLAAEMKATLKKLLIDCISDIQKSNSGADPLKYPSQILCLAESVTFTERCERAIHSNSLENLLASLKVQFLLYHLKIFLFSYVNEIIPLCKNM